jgi:hypothetical protein
MSIKSDDDDDDDDDQLYLNTISFSFFSTQAQLILKRGGVLILQK